MLYVFMQSENEIIHDIRHSVYLIKVKRLAMFTFFIIQKQRNATFAYQHD